MKHPNSYRRFSFDEKMQIISIIREGKPVAETARAEGISRTIIYKWLTVFNQQATETDFKPLGRAMRKKRGKKATPRLLERKLKKLALKNPSYSIRYIAKRSGVSVGCAWKILHKRDLTTRNSRIRHINLHGARLVHVSSFDERVAMLRRVEAGERISAVCRDFQISRTIFYQWLKSYKQSGSRTEALHDRRQRAEQHWRYIKGVSRHVLVLIEEYPELSLRQLQDIFSDDTGSIISTSGLYYALRRLGLTTYEDRLRYAKSAKDVSRASDVLIERKLPELSVFSFKSALSPPSLFAFPDRTFSLFVSFFSILFGLLVFAQPSDRIQPIPTQLGQKQQQNMLTLGFVTKKLSQTIPVRHEENFGSIQDLRWGVLAMNTNRDVYSPGQIADLSFGIVDHQGVTVCDASLSLGVIGPDKKREVFSTENGQIAMGKTCANGVYSDENDYSMQLPVKDTGDYYLSLNAVTSNGTQAQEQVLQVVTSAPYVITRAGFPSRVYPLHAYPVEIEILARENYRGKIIEKMSSKITIDGVNGRGVVAKTDKTQTVSWDVNLKKGNVYKFSYIVTFPTVSPDYYLFGPLQIGAYQEQRVWQSAIDSVAVPLPVLQDSDPAIISSEVAE